MGTFELRNYYKQEGRKLMLDNACRHTLYAASEPVNGVSCEWSSLKGPKPMAAQGLAGYFPRRIQEESMQ
jgi:hypothetical protein